MEKIEMQKWSESGEDRSLEISNMAKISISIFGYGNNTDICALLLSVVTWVDVITDVSVMISRVFLFVHNPSEIWNWEEAGNDFETGLCLKCFTFYEELLGSGYVAVVGEADSVALRYSTVISVRLVNCCSWYNGVPRFWSRENDLSH